MKSPPARLIVILGWLTALFYGTYYGLAIFILHIPSGIYPYWMGIGGAAVMSYLIIRYAYDEPWPTFVAALFFLAASFGLLVTL